MKRFTALAAVLLTLGLLLAACGSDDDPSVEGGAGTTEPMDDEGMMDAGDMGDGGVDRDQQVELVDITRRLVEVAHLRVGDAHNLTGQTGLLQLGEGGGNARPIMRGNRVADKEMRNGIDVATDRTRAELQRLAGPESPERGAEADGTVGIAINDPAALVRLAEAIYAESIKPVLEPVHNGEVVVINVDTGEYEVGPDDAEVSERASKRFGESHPRLVALRVGRPELYRMGAGLRRSA